MSKLCGTASELVQRGPRALGASKTSATARVAAGRSLSLSELSQLFEDGQRPSPTAIRSALDSGAAVNVDEIGKALHGEI